jgi:hypothetical protein
MRDVYFGISGCGPIAARLSACPRQRSISGWQLESSQAAIRKMKDLLAVLLLMFFCAPLRAQVLNKPEAAAQNTAWLQRQFDLAKPPRLPAGTLYVNATIELKPAIGHGRYYTEGGEGYPVDGHAWAAYRTRIVKTNQGPLFRIPGDGAYFVEPIELVGDGTSAAIEVHGRESPASGNHTFANITFQNWETCFDVLGGRTKEEDTHADNCLVSRCKAFDCATFARFRNQQAVNWIFQNCRVENQKTSTPKTVFDIWRGGNLCCYNLIINVPQCTIFKLHEYSPNTCKLVCRDFERDRLPVEGSYLAPVEYAGDKNAAEHYRWQIEVTGFAPDLLAPFERRLPGCEKLPKGDWKIQRELLPAATRVNSSAR